MKTAKPMRAGGFTLVEIMIVVAIIGLLAAIAIPNFVHARAKSQATACINNMHQIDGAVTEWALEQKKDGRPAPGLTPDLTPYLKLNRTAQFPNVRLAVPIPLAWWVRFLKSLATLVTRLIHLTYCLNKANPGSETRSVPQAFSFE